MFLPTVIAAFLAGAQLAAGHGAITGATGDAGGKGSAIGIDPTTPRDGTNRKPFQQDTTRFKGDAADTCGETLEGGTNDPESGTATVLQQNGGTLPQITPGGSVQMTLHQVNSDGAGPYTCMIDSTGTGTNWQSIQVTQNVDGNQKGRDQAGSETDHPLNVAIPQDQTCTGTVAGQDNVCMVRCQNPANAGPFGGCVPVQMAGNATAAETPNAAGNSTSTAGTSTTSSTAGTGTAAGTDTGDDTGDDDGDDDEDDDEEDAAGTTTDAAATTGKKNAKNARATLDKRSSIRTKSAKFARALVR